jgi:hypothetical protein
LLHSRFYATAFLKKKIFSSCNMYCICYYRNTMLSILFWHYYIEKWHPHTLFDSIIKRILCHGRKAFWYTYCVLRTYSAYESSLDCGNIHFSIDRNNVIVVSYMYLWNVQNCQVWIFCTLYIQNNLYNYYNYYNNKDTVYSYRLRRAITSSPLRNVSLKKEFMTYKQIIYSVDIHRKAMELVFIE